MDKELMQEVLVLLKDTSVPVKSLIPQIKPKLELLGDIPTMSAEDWVLINKTARERVQFEGLEAVSNSTYKYTACVMATGTGKSKIGVDRASIICKRKSNAKILIVVPTEKLRDQGWFEEFAKWGGSYIWENNVERTCYASLKKYKNEEFDFVIFDEGHNMTVAAKTFFNENVVHESLLLTATRPVDENKNVIIAGIGFKAVYELSVDEAVDLCIVSPFDITVVTIPLDAEDKYIKAGSKTKPFMQTERGNYRYLSDAISTARSEFLIRKRTNMIYNLKSKTTAAKLLLKHIIPEHKRTMIFCGSIKQAEEVCEFSFHSNKQDDADLKLFADCKISRISCVDALNEGHNISNPDCGFMVQVKSSPIDLVQRTGRIIRYRPFFRGSIIILAADGTVDLNWVKKALSILDTKYFRYITLESLRTKEETILFT